MYYLALANDDGQFEVKGMRPGAYKLFAFDDLDGGEWQEPGFLDRLEDKGVAVIAKEGATVKAAVP
jgi:hypothetical protein